MNTHISKIAIVSCLALLGAGAFGASALAGAVNAKAGSVKTGPSLASVPVSSAPAKKAQTAVSPVLVRNIELIEKKGGVIVRVHLSALTAFTHQIEPAKDGKPYRIILDCQNAIHALGANRFMSLPNTVIQSIRTSQFAVKPERVFRVVLDLQKEAFYRVQASGKHIDLFVTDATVKPFDSWSTASFLAAKTLAQKPVSKPVKETNMVKKVEKKTNVALASTTITPAKGRTVNSGASHKGTVNKTKLSPVMANAGSARVAAKTTPKSAPKTTPKTIPKKMPKATPKSLPSTLASPKLVAATPHKSAAKKSVVKKSVIEKSGSSKTVAAVKPADLKATGKMSKPAGKAVKHAQVEKKAQNKPVTVATITPKVKAVSKSVSKKAAKQPVKSTAMKSTVSKAETSSASSKLAKLAKSDSFAKKSSAVKKSSAKEKAAKKNALAKKQAKKASPVLATAGKKKSKRVSQKGSKKDSHAAKKSVKSKKSNADRKVKDSKSSSSLFASNVQAAIKPDAVHKANKDKGYSAKFRRSVDRRAIRLKGTQVAEFPRRLTIKYKSRGTRDPFASLFDRKTDKNSNMLDPRPNVESLTMVGVSRDVDGKTRGLFEDIDGRGYILSKGDRVEHGTVIKITSQKAYFQIFEYGWSRTVALSLEG